MVNCIREWCSLEDIWCLRKAGISFYFKVSLISKIYSFDWYNFSIFKMGVTHGIL